MSSPAGKRWRSIRQAKRSTSHRAGFSALGRVRASRKIEWLTASALASLGDRKLENTLKATLSEFDEMVTRGAFDGLNQKIELLEGEIHAINPAGPRHDHIIEYLNHWSVSSTDFAQIRVRVQSGLTLPDQESRPEPDVLWVKADHPANRHPIAAELFK